MITAGKADKPVVLIVDDEVATLESLVDLLRRGYHVHATDNADEALALIASRKVALLICDQRMPHITGAELLAQAAAIAPDTVRMLLTAYSDIEAVVNAINKGHIFHYVAKPWDPPAFLKIVEAATDQFSLVSENRRLVIRLAELNRSLETREMVSNSLHDEKRLLEEDNQTLQESLNKLEAAYNELRKVYEFIPVCLECGRVRTGDGRWDSFVRYVIENSAFISHGLCPQCVQHIANNPDGSRDKSIAS